MPYAVPWRRLDLRHTCAINVTLLGLSLLISNSPALETIQGAVLVSLNWTGGITSADVKPSLARFMHIHMDGAYRSNSFFLNSCTCAHSVRYRHCIREWQKPVLWLVVDLSYCTNQSGKQLCKSSKFMHCAHQIQYKRICICFSAQTAWNREKNKSLRFFYLYSCSTY